MTTLYSNGKLLLTGEYLVLDGANALAIPTKFGQSLRVATNTKNCIIWTSYDHQNNIWFNHQFKLNASGFKHKNTLNQLETSVASRLTQILNAAKALNPHFLSSSQGYTITTTLDFPNNWGLGTSSTLIHNIASWANVNPFALLQNTFGGSGYDIACAMHNTPICYQKNEETPIINAVNFNPSFKNNLYFVFLNNKQNSRDSINNYLSNKSNLNAAISKINAITSQFIACNTLSEFQGLMREHEAIIANLIRTKTVKQLLFADFDGEIKSLGGWGGDFVLVAAKNNPSAYFKSKGYQTIFAYAEMILEP